jgi:2,3-bisphosphoglycerate-independent phosphoglycerate mutase
MKYVVIIGDGMADRGLKELGGMTPLQKAFTPNMDKLAREGAPGMVRTVPEGILPGSDVANLSILGYDPGAFYTGRAPLEAASMGVKLDDRDVAYRCNLVTLSFNRERTKARMEDYSAGHISTEEARVLIEDLNAKLGSKDISFYPGISYRHLMVWSGGESGPECTPPHDIIGKEVTDYLPLGPGCELLKELMVASLGVLEGHEINKKRAEGGKNPANSIWLWGQGRKPSLPPFSEKYGLKGAMVSAVDLTKGLGIYAGLEILDVPGVTGYLDTNYVGKAEYSLKALETVDLVYIHVEAPDEASHSGSYKDKIRAIEDIDALVLGTILRGMRAFEDYRILLMTDHPTPVELRTHTDEPVPFVIYDSRVKNQNRVGYNEEIANAEGVVRVERGHELMDHLIKSELPGESA